MGRQFAIRGFVALTAVAALPMPAWACPFSEAMKPMLFEELPAVPADAVAARVQILARNPHEPVVRARIVEMIRGDYAGASVRLEPSYHNSCDRFPLAGETGIVVGRVISSSPEALVIDPVWAPSLVDRGEFRVEAVPTPK
jgi:hypothetical protein